MQKFYYSFALLLTSLFLLANVDVFSQAVQDPASLPVYEASGPITVDGVLDESDWAINAPNLIFRKNGIPSNRSNTPDTGIVVKAPYTDTSTCYVKFLHYGSMLYVSLKSDDKQVGIFDWEGDGMFMKVVNGAGQDCEFKLYVRNATHLIGAEGGGATPEGSDAYGGVGIVDGTVLDSSDTDNGYTAEGYIDLSQLFDTPPTSIQVTVNIFDPDYYTLGSPAGFGGYGDFAKQWWGSEWGGVYRTLDLVQSQSPYDPASLPVYEASAPITVDGMLNESDWTTDVPQLMFKVNGTPSGLSFSPTNAGLVVKAPYTDTSTCYVKFLHYGSMLYVSLKSDDKQVGIFDWEGDGMFMKVVNGAGQDCEFKLYVRNATHLIGAEGGGATPEGSDAYGGVGIVDGTVLDSSDTDNGYTAEGYIDLSQLFDTPPTSIQVTVNIFDPDYYTLGSPAGFGGYGDFAKQWWGSEWGGVYRTLDLVQGTSDHDPVSLPVYALTSPITVDGVLDESDWAADVPQLKFRLNGTPSGLSYTPTNAGIVVKEPYTDTSTCYVKFLHDENKLYVSLKSDDKQVGIFDWEGDGMFMKVVNGAGQDCEFKLYVRNATHLIGAEGGGATPEGSDAYGGVGIVDGTVLDSSDTDNGYTAEGYIDLSQLFDTPPTSIQVTVNIFDPDYYTLGSPAGFGGYGDFAKQWWGSEWGGVYRTLDLMPLTSVDDQSGLIPAQFNLSQNYPNPFNPSTTINFSLPVNAKVKIDIVNILGQKIKTLVDADYSAGNHELNFNASNLSSGIYIYRIDASGQNGKVFSSSKKMILMK